MATGMMGEFGEWRRAFIARFPGKIGDILRANYYRARLAHCGAQPRFAYNIRILCPEKLSIADNVEIAWDTVLDATGGIAIGEWSGVGPGSMLLASGEYYTDPNSPVRKPSMPAQPIRIGRDVWIGANCIVNMGVTIGDGAILSAGSVIGKNVPPFALMSGNPARVVGWRKPPEVPAATNPAPGNENPTDANVPT